MSAQQTLFGLTDEQPTTPLQGTFAAVALEDSLDKLLDYIVPDKLESRIAVGQRVKVPLGKRNRPVHGYVIAVKNTCAYPRVKPLLGIADERALIAPKMLDLARWMSRYYCAPLGTVIDSVIPAAVKKKIGLDYLTMVDLARPRDEVQSVFETTRSPKRRTILARMLQLPPGESIELFRLAEESQTTPATIRKLAKLGVLSIKEIPDYSGSPTQDSGLSTQDWMALNDDQQKVFDELMPRMTGGFSVNLLYGVTGSGKTEVYLRCINEIIKQGRQAIVMVPEIALTPQTVRRFTARFPRVAVLHSGLTAGQRHRFWMQCASGNADVVVGARSAVFAPLPNLGILVVDEEHEASYKQDQSPRYQGRDVAIKRAQLENIPVLLGSATPSLETYWRVQGSGFRVQSKATERRSDEATKGKTQDSGLSTQDSSLNPEPRTPNPSYHLLTLPRRVRDLAMPHVELVDMKTESRLHARPGIHLFSRRLEHLLKTTVEKGQQAILLLNRRGYSNFVFCASCQEPLHCQYCDTTMTYHRTVAAHARSGTLAEGLHTGQLQCHYCLASTALPDKCPACAKKLSLFGLGTQRVEEEFERKFPGLAYARVDSDSMRSSKDYESTLTRFGKGEIQVMLGTQMIAKGLDYPNVTLVGVISGDTALALPDFRAAERTFQLITQVAGRAGRGDAPGRVILQTFMPEDPTIQAALRQDYTGFAATELQHRRDVGLPPFARMIRIIIRDQDQDKLHKKSEDLGALMTEAVERVAHVGLASASATPTQDSGLSTQDFKRDSALGTLIAMKGPMPCAISRIAGYFRNQIVLTSPRPDLLQKVIALVREQGHLATQDRIAVDVDPVSLL